jgi:hypothetical protein
MDITSSSHTSTFLVTSNYYPSYLTSYEMRTFWLESMKGIDHSEDLGVDGRIILKQILVKTEFGCVN